MKNVRWPRSGESAANRALSTAGAARTSGHRERRRGQHYRPRRSGVHVFRRRAGACSAAERLGRLRISAHWPPPGNPPRRARPERKAELPFGPTPRGHYAERLRRPRRGFDGRPTRPSPSPRGGSGAERVGVQVRVHGRPFGMVRGRRVLRRGRCAGCARGDDAPLAGSLRWGPLLQTRDPFRQDDRAVLPPLSFGWTCGCAAVDDAPLAGSLRYGPHSHFHYWSAERRTVGLGRHGRKRNRVGVQAHHWPLDRPAPRRHRGGGSRRGSGRRSGPGLRPSGWGWFVGGGSCGGGVERAPRAATTLRSQARCAGAPSSSQGTRSGRTIGRSCLHSRSGWFVRGGFSGRGEVAAEAEEVPARAAGAGAAAGARGQEQDPELSLNAAVQRIGPRVGVNPGHVAGLVQAGRHRRRSAAGDDDGRRGADQGAGARGPGAEAGQRDPAGGLLVSSRGSSTRDCRGSRVHRRPPGPVRGRADLPGAHRARRADRPEHLLRRQGPAAVGAGGPRRPSCWPRSAGSTPTGARPRPLRRPQGLAPAAPRGPSTVGRRAARSSG